MADVDSRTSSAYHEAAHAVAAICLDLPVSVVSLRPGTGYRAVTMFDPATDHSREAREWRIVVALAGPLGEMFAEPFDLPVPSLDVVTEAIASLEHRSPVTHARLLAAEADNEFESDEVCAHRASMVLTDWDEWLTSAHLMFIHRWALKLVESHLRPLRRLAGEVYERDVVEGAEVASIVWGTGRCVCHADWGTTAFRVAHGLS